MIKTRYGSIVSHKFNSEYICYDSSIQPILKDRILSSLATDDYRLTNNSNFLDLNNGLIKKHFCRKGLMYIFSDNYIYNGLKKTRPVRELTNYIDFNHLIETSNNDWIINKIELCFPVFAYIKRNYLFYKGDIVLSKILGKTLGIVRSSQDQGQLLHHHPIRKLLRVRTETWSQHRYLDTDLFLLK